MVEQPGADNVDELKQQLEEEQLRLESFRQDHLKCNGRLQQAQTVATKLKVSKLIIWPSDRRAVATLQICTQHMY